jgi:PAS domain S-box-containing protein
MEIPWKDKFYMAFRLCPFIMTIHSFPDMTVLDVNEAYERKTGLSRDEVVGKTIFEIGLWTDQGAIKRWFEKLEKKRKIYNLEVHFRNKAGEDFNGLASSELFDGPNGQQVLSILEDNSIRKRAEESFRVSEAKFRRVFQEAGIGMLIGTLGSHIAEGHYVAANPAFCQMVGYSEEELCDKTFRSLIHPDDLQHAMQSLESAIEEGGRAYQVEFRHVRKNRSVVWTENTASLIRNPDGTLQYFVAGIVDITARKEAELVVANLSGRLIQAQEDERRIFAREIHDNIGQQAVAISIGLHELGKSFDSKDPRETAIQNLVSSIGVLSDDLRRLSHQLHSSKLEYVGLVPAINMLREEYETQRVELDFTHQDIPRDLPWKVSISVFRVIQEAVSNATKYSGVRKVSVQLNGSPGEISLFVHNSGVGFDVEKAKWKGGLGLISMEERVKLLGGTISIVSGRTSGTSISARIPIREYHLPAVA